uniref:Uncharacterized protein n=1 Tax=Arundo donax TaxID=35708 RepID=A0A0A8YX81_ARUDO
MLNCLFIYQLTLHAPWIIPAVVTMMVQCVDFYTKMLDR